MALKIALDSAMTNVVSEGTGTNPITVQLPVTGGNQSVELYLFNDDNTKYYSGISIDPQDSGATDNSAWVQLAPNNAGVAGTYGAGGAALSMADIGSAGTPDTVAHPFWYKVTTPSGETVQNYTTITLGVTAQEFAV